MKNKVLMCPGYERKEHKCKPSDFYTDDSRRGSCHSYYCKECHKARNRKMWKEKYYPDNREKLIEINKERQKKRLLEKRGA